jgi:hypothetical protein
MIDIPEKPKDGHRIHYWMFNGCADGLTHHRVTYYANMPCHEVTGCEVGRGVPYVDDWYHEMRYVPTEPYWRGNGRNRTEDLIAMFSRANDPPAGFTSAIYETFKEAREALYDSLTMQYAAKLNAANRLLHIRDTLPTEPTAEQER